MTTLISSVVLVLKKGDLGVPDRRPNDDVTLDDCFGQYETKIRCFRVLVLRLKSSIRNISETRFFLGG